MKSWGYPLVCVLVPQLWAVLVARFFAVRARRKDLAARARAAETPRDFSI